MCSFVVSFARFDIVELILTISTYIFLVLSFQWFPSPCILLHIFTHLLPSINIICSYQYSHFSYTQHLIPLQLSFSLSSFALHCILMWCSSALHIQVMYNLLFTKCQNSLVAKRGISCLKFYSSVLAAMLSKHLSWLAHTSTN